MVWIYRKHPELELLEHGVTLDEFEIASDGIEQPVALSLNS